MDKTSIFYSIFFFPRAHSVCLLQQQQCMAVLISFDYLSSISVHSHHTDARSSTALNCTIVALPKIVRACNATDFAYARKLR